MIIPLSAVPGCARPIIQGLMLMLLQTSGLIEPRIHITNGSRPTRDVDVRYIITRVSSSNLATLLKSLHALRQEIQLPCRCYMSVYDGLMGALCSSTWTRRRWTRQRWKRRRRAQSRPCRRRTRPAAWRRCTGAPSGTASSPRSPRRTRASASASSSAGPRCSFNDSRFSVFCMEEDQRPEISHL